MSDRLHGQMTDPRDRSGNDIYFESNPAKGSRRTFDIENSRIACFVERAVYAATAAAWFQWQYYYRYNRHIIYWAVPGIWTVD